MIGFTVVVFPSCFSLMMRSTVPTRIYWPLQIHSNTDKEAAKFSQMWNKIIESFREEDLINNK